MLERTLILIKPDGVQRGLVGEVIGRFERRGLRLVGMKLMQMSRDLAERHYVDHKDESYYEGLVTFITSGPLVAMVWEGPQAITAARATMGVTQSFKAAPGTIRGDLALETRRNIVHGSDSLESAAREIELFFKSEEVLTWDQSIEPWVYER
jgi:nucleoside-diphosphate kinase